MSVAVVAMTVAFVTMTVASVTVVTTLTIMIAIIMPVVAVTFIPAVADNYLVGTPPVICIPGSYIGLMFPWIALVYNNFIAMIPVEVVSWG